MAPARRHRPATVRRRLCTARRPRNIWPSAPLSLRNAARLERLKSPVGRRKLQSKRESAPLDFSPDFRLALVGGIGQGERRRSRARIADIRHWSARLRGVDSECPDLPRRHEVFQSEAVQFGCVILSGEVWRTQSRAAFPLVDSVIAAAEISHVQHAVDYLRVYDSRRQIDWRVPYSLL